MRNFEAHPTNILQRFQMFLYQVTEKPPLKIFKDRFNGLSKRFVCFLDPLGVAGIEIFAKVSISP